VDVAEFDRFADEYHEMHRANIAITGEAPEFFARYKVRVLGEIVRELGIEARALLDFGSGIGNSIPFFREYFPQAQLIGADVSQRSLELAELRFPGQSTGMPLEGDRIPAEPDRFDVAFSACVFHHIPHQEHVAWLSELRRVVRPGGALSVFEHNPLNPLTVRAVDTCPFDENAHLLRARELAERYRAAGWTNPRIRYHVFFPRALARLRPIEQRLTWLPVGAQYSVTATK